MDKVEEISPRLKEIRISITPECTLNCTYCYNDQTRTSEKTVGIGEIKDSIRETKEQRLETVSFTGGEPLLERTLLIEAISYCNDQGLETGVLTNGTLLTPNIVEELKESGLSWIRISLDGSSDPINSRTRRGNITIDEIARGMHYLSQAHIPMILRPTITPHNTEDVENLAKFALNNNTSSIEFQPYIPLGKDRDNEFRLPLKKHFEVAERLMKLKKEYHGTLDVVLYSNWFEFTLDSYDGTLPYLSKCGREFLFIDFNGDIKSCAPMKKVVGSVFNKNLLRIFNQDPFLRQIQKPTARGVCGSCEYFSEMCRPCPAPTYNLRGTLKTPPVLCPNVRKTK